VFYVVDSRSPDRLGRIPTDQCSPSAGFPARRIHPIRSIETRSAPASLAATLAALPSILESPFPRFKRCNGKRTNVRCARSRSQCLTLQAACVAGKTSHSDVATAIGRTQSIRPIRLRSGQEHAVLDGHRPPLQVPAFHACRWTNSPWRGESSTGLAPTPRSYRDAIRDSRIATFDNKPAWAR